MGTWHGDLQWQTLGGTLVLLHLDRWSWCTNISASITFNGFTRFFNGINHNGIFSIAGLENWISLKIIARVLTLFLALVRPVIIDFCFADSFLRSARLFCCVQVDCCNHLTGHCEIIYNSPWKYQYCVSIWQNVDCLNPWSSRNLCIFFCLNCSDKNLKRNKKEIFAFMLIALKLFYWHI